MAGGGDDWDGLEARLIGLADNWLEIWSSPSKAVFLLRAAAAALAECRRALEAAEDDLVFMPSPLPPSSLAVVRAVLAKLKGGS